MDRRRRILSGLCTVLIAVAFLAEVAHAEKRVALVVGNSSYRHVDNLPNPVNDAAAIAKLFQAAGFTVDLRHDLGIAELRRAIGDFAEQARNADVAVVFYAGHGIEVDGTNYLIPVDAILARDFDVEDETISLDRVLKAIESAKRLRFVMLDACRENPFSKRIKRTISTRTIGRGFAKVEPTAPDTLVAFAAEAGTVAEDGAGANSPFTAALVKHIATPGLDLRLAFGRVRDEVMKSTGSRQRPFIYGSLGGTAVAIVDAPAVAPQLSPVTPTSTEAERAWTAVKNTASEAELRAFIKRFPDSFFADLANAHLEELKKNRSEIATPVQPQPRQPAPAAATQPPASASAQPAPIQQTQAAAPAQPHGQLMFSAWTKICNKDQEQANAKEVCQIIKKASLESGQFVAGAALVETGRARR
jgi:hypothetical protein